MATSNFVNGSISPDNINLSWDRAAAFPQMSDISLSSSNAEFVDVSMQFIGTSVEWIEAVNYSGTFFTIPDFNTLSVLSLSLKNLDQLAGNQYQAKIHFTFMKIGGSPVTRVATVNLSIIGNTGVQTDKSVYSVVYNSISGAVSGDTLVQIMNNTGGSLLRFDFPNQVFKVKENFTDNFTIEQNTANPFAQHPDIPLSGAKDFNCRIFKMDGSFISNFIVRVIAIDQNFSVLPNQLDMVKIGNAEITVPLSVVNPAGYSFTVSHFPNWLSVIPAAGNATADLSVTTSTANLSSGKHTGVITITYDTNKTINVPVVLNYKKFLDLDGDAEFCLDLEPVVINRIWDEANFVKVEMDLDFNVLGVASSVSKTFIEPYVGDVAHFELGEKAHRYFPRPRKSFFNETEFEFCKKITATVKFTEVDADFMPLTSEQISMELFPGKRPAMFPFLHSVGHRKKNLQTEFFISEAQDGIAQVSHVINGSQSEGSASWQNSILLYDFPVTFSAVAVQFETQNYTPDWFTFTGDFRISADYNHIYAKSIFRRENEKYDVRRVRNLKINTGFILATERYVIDELVRSRLVFAKINGKIYRMFCTTPKLDLESNDEELYQYDLEFIISEQDGN